MKLRLLLIFLTVSVCSNAQTFQEGTNLQAEYSKVSKPYFFEAPCYTSWIEGANLLLIGDRPDQNDCDFVFLALHDTTLIGVYKTQEPHYFIFDTEGNSILGKPTAYFQLPLWTVMKNIHIDSSDMKVLKVLDKFYEMTLQDNYLDLNAATLKEFNKYQTNTSLANRHIVLLFYNYLSFIGQAAEGEEQPPPDICLQLIKSLSDACFSLYKKIPVIVRVYRVEALINAGMIDEAREYIKNSLCFYPGSIPLLVYNYKLEADKDMKKRQLVLLKKKYGSHWMVKDL